MFLSPGWLCPVGWLPYQPGFVPPHPALPPAGAVRELTEVVTGHTGWIRSIRLDGLTGCCCCLLVPLSLLPCSFLSSVCVCDSLTVSVGASTSYDLVPYVMVSCRIWGGGEFVDSYWPACTIVHLQSSADRSTCTSVINTCFNSCSLLPLRRHPHLILCVNIGDCICVFVY